MTLIEVINKVDTVKPNGYSEQEKIGWLSTLDGIVKAIGLEPCKLCTYCWTGKE